MREGLRPYPLLPREPRRGGGFARRGAPCHTQTMRLAYWASMAAFGVVAAASLAYWGMTVIIAGQGLLEGSASVYKVILSVVWVAAQAVLPGLACLLLWKLTRRTRAASVNRFRASLQARR